VLLVDYFYYSIVDAEQIKRQKNIIQKLLGVCFLLLDHTKRIGTNVGLANTRRLDSKQIVLFILLVLLEL